MARQFMPPKPLHPSKMWKIAELWEINAENFYKLTEIHQGKIIVSMCVLKGQNLRHGMRPLGAELHMYLDARKDRV